MATDTISTPNAARSFVSDVSDASVSSLSVALSALSALCPTTPATPGAPLRRQGVAHPRFAAFDGSLEFVRPTLHLTPLTRRLQFAAVYRRLAVSTPSPASPGSSDSLSGFSGSCRPSPPRFVNQLTHDLSLCPQGELVRWESSLALDSGKLEAAGSWVSNLASPLSCESAVVSPVASSVNDPWSPRSLSTVTVASDSPLAGRHRLPMVPSQQSCTLLGMLAGKRFWRFSSFLKQAYINTLHRDDPQQSLQTPDNLTRTVALHKWITDIPTPVTPSPFQAPTAIGSCPSLFSSPMSPPVSSPMSPSLRFTSGSPDSLAFLSQPSSPVASPSTRSPLAASVRSEHPPPVVEAESPHNPNLTDALAKLKELIEAGPPVALSSPSSSPSVSPALSTRSALAATRSLKRKLPQDASPPPRRLRPAVTRFEAPTPVFHFAPALPESVPSFPVDVPAMPGTFPADFPTEIRLEPTTVTPSPTSSSLPWKTIGIAVGAFALGVAVSRYLF
ncbi:hypothetical protein KVR01_011089 [Diaporthe batatas]|uniref:uncharacterized protein n=1 Tax=Diaporthe batatas TaxID=748121 RepID=UPI001D046496|nr:uncharacterized protein KVR01_011089 [Diaporthe batatas]KAG8159428.1 hypothetical protein KVR01_011089 [Diaporthe batatas]